MESVRKTFDPPVCAGENQWIVTRGVGLLFSFCSPATYEAREEKILDVQRTSGQCDVKDAIKLRM